MFGKKHPKEWVENNSKSHIGIKHTKETILKMINSRTGTKRSEKTKQKMSESHSGNKNPMYGRTGEENPSSKLNWDIINEIRDLYKNGGQSIRKLAKMFNVANSTIHNILINKTWKI